MATCKQKNAVPHAAATKTWALIPHLERFHWLEVPLFGLAQRWRIYSAGNVDWLRLLLNGLQRPLNAIVNIVWKCKKKCRDNDANRVVIMWQMDLDRTQTVICMKWTATRKNSNYLHETVFGKSIRIITASLLKCVQDNLDTSKAGASKLSCIGLFRAKHGVSHCISALQQATHNNKHATVWAVISLN